MAKMMGRRTLSNGIFALFVFLSLTTPSWRYGPFSWWPVWTLDNLAGGPVRLGVLNLLPAILALLWLAGAVRRRRATRPDAVLTLPFVAFTVWALLRLDPTASRLLFIYGGAFALAWLIYLFVVGERPPLAPALAPVIIVQSLVGVGQFLRQGDLGLTVLGELPLNPAFRGVTVLYARQRPWLRAYGLTAHPNLLGALLAVAIVLLLPALSRSRKWGRRMLLLTITIGLVGLFLTFSRAAWLGFGVGVSLWLILGGRPDRSFAEGRRLLPFLVPLLALAILSVLYGDLVLSRFLALERPLEARSISQRLQDARVALEILFAYPFSGSGLGRFVETAGTMTAGTGRVHNVFLLVAAELGIVGLGLVSWLLLWPPISLLRICSTRRQLAFAGALSPWLVMLVVNQLDTTLWVTSNWQTAILFALVAGTYVNHRGQISPAAP